MIYPIGFTIINAQYETLTVKGYYMIKDEQVYYMDNNELITENSMEFYVNKQDKWNESHKRYIIREAEEREQELKEAEQMKEQRKHIDEYLDQFSGIKRAKIDTTLSKEENYSSGLYTRYQWIEKGVTEGKRVEVKTFLNMFNRRAKNDYKTEICMFSDENTFTAITKTEQDYFNWLISNK
jgi:hypothetical protein